MRGILSRRTDRMMRRRGALLIVGLSLHFVPKADAAPQRPDRVVTVDRLCGRLLSVRDADTPQEKVTSLSKTVVRLYRQVGDADCCNGSTLTAESLSGRGGKFEFKNIPAGLYWVAMMPQAGEHKLLVRYEPAKGDPTNCSELLYELDEAGHFILRTFVTVD
jgi:hypothetical protein